MDRLKEYCSFAVRFAGIGYAVLWPFASCGRDGGLFGSALLCSGAGQGTLAFLCRGPYPLSLSPALHVLGAVSTGVVILCLAHSVMCRLRRRRARSLPARAHPGPAPSCPHKLNLRSSAIKPRNHFGLRGIKEAAGARDMA